MTVPHIFACSSCQPQRLKVPCHGGAGSQRKFVSCFVCIDSNNNNNNNNNNNELEHGHLQVEIERSWAAAKLLTIVSRPLGALKLTEL